MENFTMVNFNYFDVTIGTIILLLAIKGFMNGVIKEFFGLAGLVGGVYFASRLAGESAAFISKNFIQIENASLLKLIGFISILIIIWLSATILGSIISKLTSASGLGFMDRLLGFVAGGGKYFIIFALITTALSNVTLIKENTQRYVKDSILYPFLYKAGSVIIKIDPTSLGLNAQKDFNTSSSVTGTQKDSNISSLSH
jgi:membrane protein required for colicin V production